MRRRPTSNARFASIRRALARRTARIFLASALAAMLGSASAQAQTSFTSTAGTGVWGSARWNNTADGPTYTSAFTANNAVNFTAGTYTFSTGIGTGNTANVGNVTLADGVTVNFTGTTAGTYATGGQVRTITVGTGSTFNMSTQGISTAAGTGFIKNGAGTWTTAGGAYTGGFTLNAGTLALAGATGNGMGSGASQVLTINGGTIRSSNTTAHNLTGKYGGGIVVGGDFALGDATNNGALTFTNNTNLGAASRTITVNSGVTWGGIISGDPVVGITKAGTGTLTLSGANTYSGGTTVTGGVLNAGASSTAAFGTGAVTVNSGRIQLSGGATVSNALTINGGGAAGSGVLFVADGSSATYAGTINITAGPAAGGHFGSNIAAGTGTLTLTGAITSSVPVAIRNGNIVLANAGSSYTQLNVNQVSTRLGVDNAIPVGASVDLALSGNASLNLNGFNQTLAGITRNGAFTGTVTNGGAASTTSTLTMTGTSTFSGVIQNGTGTTALTVNGGAFTVTGTNTYTGATNVTAGTLATSGTGTIAAGSAITINGAGAKFLHNATVANASAITLMQGTLTGTGTVGAVTVADSAGAIISNNNSAIGGALTTGNLTFNGAATINTFNSGLTASIVSGAITTNAAGTVTINPTGTWVSGSTHTLLSYTGGSIGGAGDSQIALGTIGGLSGRQAAGPLVNTGSAFTLDITGDSPVWSGAGSSNWSTATLGDNTGPNAWATKTALTGTNFWASDAAEFNDNYDDGGGPLAVTNTNVNIMGGVAPASTTFNNSAVNYTINSSDSTGITSGVLVKNGTGTVTINTANTYTGSTTINGGTLQLGNGGDGGSLSSSSPITVGTGATFAVNQSDTVTQGTDFSSAPITGAGSFAKAGSGTTVLNAANTFSGGATVSAGTLIVDRNNTLHSLGSGAVSIAPGASIEMNMLRITATTETIANAFTGSGRLELNFAANTTARNTTLSGISGFGGAIELSSSGVTGDTLLASSLGTSNASLVINSGNSMTVLAGNATFNGGITVNGAGNNEGRGAIRVAGATTVVGGDIKLASSSTISMETAGSQITGNVSSSVAGAHTLTLGAPTGSVAGTLAGNISDGTGSIGISTNGGNYTLSGVLSHSGGFNVVNSGLITLSNANNTYAGATAIGTGNGRTVLVTANGALGATGVGNETTIGSLGQLGFSGGLIYSSAEKIIGSGTGNGNAQGVFAGVQRGFIQSVSGNNTFAGDIELNANGLSRIGAQDGASLTLSGDITQATGVTTASVLFRAGNLNGDFVTLSGTGNALGGDSQVFSSGTLVAGQYAGLRIGADNAHPTNITVKNFVTASNSQVSFDMNGNDQSLNGLVDNGAGTLNFINLDTVNASTLTLNPTANQNSGVETTILGGSPGGTPLGVIHLVKSGAFSQTLSGTNSYTGTTLVSGGALVVNGNNSAATGAVTVSSGATLAGSGTIGGDTTIAGTHSPGNSPGIQTFVGDLTYSTGANFNWELTNNTITNAPNPSAIFDSVVVGGDLDFAGATSLNLALNSGGTVLWSDSFWATDRLNTNGWLLFDVAGTTTNLNNFSLNTIDWLDSGSNTLSSARAGASFSLFQSGNDVYLNYAATAIPEPGTFAFLAVAIVGGGLYRRSRIQNTTPEKA